MEIHNFSLSSSLINRYMAQLRNVDIQHDSMRFRRNLERIGEIIAYEISKTLDYKTCDITTPLAIAKGEEIADKIVLATIFRAGLPFHTGFLNYFDNAENAFVSAYRRYKEKGDFDVCIEYLASPRLDGKVMILCDPMLATGVSMEMSYKALLTKGNPKHVHIASVVASEQAVRYVEEHFPSQSTTLWTATVDPSLNAHSYIVPGLGDAGDLAFGEKD